MWQGIIAVCAVLGPLIGYLVWRLKQEKTKAQKAMEIAAKGRAEIDHGKLLNQARSNEELEKHVKRVLGDVGAILRSKKPNSPDGGKNP